MNNSNIDDFCENNNVENIGSSETWIFQKVEKKLQRKLTKHEKEIVLISFDIGFDCAESSFQDTINYHGINFK